MIYFIGNQKGAVKIGITINLPARMKKLQTGSPHRLRLLAWTFGDESAEAAYHEQFAHLRINGEWFSRKAELSDEIKRLLKVGICPTDASEKMSNRKSG
ncbi:GIY-YIG nuclease family protein [Novosphingobium sp. EMRT-2]|uniref:GIY-YIG nuclease family protein n=1 Tax=Novosphingobium sp. EMRT-2 TaxID=2571749 RepID=UPI00143D7013|nr:GIY-YIG nuclease family protein [Novosphingobium sp. EMRT-2]